MAAAGAAATSGTGSEFHFKTEPYGACTCVARPDAVGNCPGCIRRGALFCERVDAIAVAEPLFGTDVVEALWSCRVGAVEHLAATGNRRRQRDRKIRRPQFTDALGV